VLSNLIAELKSEKWLWVESKKSEEQESIYRLGEGKRQGSGHTDAPAQALAVSMRGSRG
jgi:hypothetical protein